MTTQTYDDTIPCCDVGAVDISASLFAKLRGVPYASAGSLLQAFTFSASTLCAMPFLLGDCLPDMSKPGVRLLYNTCSSTYLCMDN